MKKFFKWLSGKPKNGDVIECINPILFTFSMGVAITAILFGYSTGNYFERFFYTFVGVIFAWQAGWGMSMERFYKNEIKNGENNNEK